MELPLSRCKAPRTQIQPIVYFDPTPGARLSDHLTAPPIGAAHAVYQPRSFPAPTLRSSPLIAPDAVGMIKRSIRKARKSMPRRRPRPSALEAPSPQPMQLTPPEWVMYPYLKAVRKLIRPPTARTRRKQVKVSVPFSRSCFEHLMAQMQENDVDDLERTPAGRLIPTKETKALLRFNYKISKPTALNTFFSLEKTDMLLPAGGSRRGPFRRGSGAARAHVTAKDARQGKIAGAISMACGNTLIHFKESTNKLQQPTLTVLFFVMTMDKSGHVLWPTVFSDKARAMLRKAARRQVQIMMDSSDHPVDASWGPSLTGTGSSTTWQPAPRPTVATAPAATSQA